MLQFGTSWARLEKRHSHYAQKFREQVYNIFEIFKNWNLVSRFFRFQTKFIEHFQCGKHIGKILHIKNKQKRHRAPKPILLGLKSENYGNQIPNFEFLKNILNLLTKFLCRMGQTLFQTSSRGSEIKQNRFGWKFKYTVKM